MTRYRDDRDDRFGTERWDQGPDMSYEMERGHLNPTYTYGGDVRAYGPDYEQTHTSYRGIGPRGYRRSDDRIREEVSEALEDEHGVDASDIEVQVQDGEVTLTGTVGDRSQKRMAEDCVARVRGVKDVHNRLRVQPQGHWGESGSTSGMTGTTTIAVADTGTSGNEEG